MICRKIDDLFNIICPVLVSSELTLNVYGITWLIIWYMFHVNQSTFVINGHQLNIKNDIMSKTWAQWTALYIEYSYVKLQDKTYVEI